VDSPVCSLPFFEEIIILVSYGIWIWMTGNNFIFRNIKPTQQHAYYIFRKEFILVILRAKGPLETPMKEWIDNLL
jgi:hypothetical protein